MIDDEELVADLEAVTGDALRSVATYDEDGYDILYLREGLADRAADVAEEIHQNLVLEGIGKEYLEDLFAAGDLHCTLHQFEELRAYHFVTDQFEGVFVGVDTGAAVETAAVRDVVHDHADV
jgi:hypothetical protein